MRKCKSIEATLQKMFRLMDKSNNNKIKKQRIKNAKKIIKKIYLNKFKFEEYDKIGDMMPIYKWVSCVEEGEFIDYDGFGLLAKDNKQSNIYIYIHH